MMKNYFTFFTMIYFLTACSAPSSDLAGPAPAVTTPEIEFCTTSTTYSPSVSLTGTATFFKRGLTVTTSLGSVTQMVLGAPISTALPIKFAEVRVLNSSGTVVQCGKTNAAGDLKALDGTSTLMIPNAAGSYTIEVLARANHTLSVPVGKTAFNFYTSVKTDLLSNVVYKISQAATSNGVSPVSTTMVAYARESESSEILGGAFNIYNDLVIAYEYLAQNTALSNLTCLSPKLDVYWKAGYNPAQYLYPSSDPSTLGTVSFYSRGDRRLFINGGRLGNVTTQDTDHFDDTVIIHELGHHIEDSCGKMDSPGGTHYGLYRIDPRLAWSEGWGNFFGAHIVKNNISSLNGDVSASLPGSGWLQYLDTQGYTEGSTTSGGSLILINLTRAGNNPETITTTQGVRRYDQVDPTTDPGEGHFREVSIARSLFKGTNTCATLCSNTNYFEYYWKAFEKDLTGIGMGKPNYPFRTSSRFFNRLNAAFAGSMPASIDATLNTDEAQQREANSSYVVSGSQIWPAYAVKLVSSGSTPCTNPLKMQPRQEYSNVTNGFADQRYSNHFFWVDLSVLSGITEINLVATKNAGTSVDIDLILYKEGYLFQEDCVLGSNGSCSSYAKLSSADMLRTDRSVAATPGTSFTKKIQTLNTLSTSSSYLLNVRAYTANRTVAATTDYSYTLTNQSGDYLCPSATY